jgi:hypothetical protein
MAYTTILCTSVLYTFYCPLSGFLGIYCWVINTLSMRAAANVIEQPAAVQWISHNLQLSLSLARSEAARSSSEVID